MGDYQTEITISQHQPVSEKSIQSHWQTLSPGLFACFEGYWRLLSNIKIRSKCYGKNFTGEVIQKHIFLSLSCHYMIFNKSANTSDISTFIQGREVLSSLWEPLAEAVRHKESLIYSSATHFYICANFFFLPLSLITFTGSDMENDTKGSQETHTRAPSRISFLWEHLFLPAQLLWAQTDSVRLCYLIL